MNERESEKEIYVGKSKHSRQYVAPLTRQGEGVRAEFDTYKLGTYLRYIGEMGPASASQATA